MFQNLQYDAVSQLQLGEVQSTAQRRVNSGWNQQPAKHWLSGFKTLECKALIDLFQIQFRGFCLQRAGTTRNAAGISLQQE